MEVTTLKRFVFLSLSLLLLLILIPGCFTVSNSATDILTPPVGNASGYLVFSSNPSTINAGGTSTLLWNVTGANSVSIDQGIGQVDVAGTRVVSPATSTVYTISCYQLRWYRYQVSGDYCQLGTATPCACAIRGNQCYSQYFAVKLHRSLSQNLHLLRYYHCQRSRHSYLQVGKKRWRI